MGGVPVNKVSKAVSVYQISLFEWFDVTGCASKDAPSHSIPPNTQYPIRIAGKDYLKLFPPSPLPPVCRIIIQNESSFYVKV